MRGAYIGRLRLPDLRTTSAHVYLHRGLIGPLVTACGHSLGEAEPAALGELAARSRHLFSELQPRLIHGDLWGGNWLAAAAGRAYFIDPAAHCGLAELDLALARLFGGFPPQFFAAYDELRPPLHGRDRRLPSLQLYYLLAHLAMFGTGYLPRVRAALRGALAAC